MGGDRDGAEQSTESREQLFHRTYDWSATTPSMAILTTLGTLEGVDPVELPDVHGITLYDYVNPEALDTLVAGDGQITLSFVIEEYQVRIDGDALTIARE